jgi:hypothetical protein
MTWLAAGVAAAAAAAALLQPPPAGVRIVDRGTSSMIEEQRTAVASTPAQFAALWREHSGEPQPAVDFAKETVVAIFLGTRNTAGYTVDIAGVERTPAAVIVHYRERQPAPDAVTAQMLTFPFVIAAIPRGDVQVRIERAP